jgi:hypothetical protein
MTKDPKDTLQVEATVRKSRRIVCEKSNILILKEMLQANETAQASIPSTNWTIKAGRLQCQTILHPEIPLDQLWLAV